MSNIDEESVLETLRQDLEYRSINGDEKAEKELRRLDRERAKNSKMVMFAYFNKGEPDSHPCEKNGCNYLALYDDEPYCLDHSENRFHRALDGYSYRKLHKV